MGTNEEICSSVREVGDKRSVLLVDDHPMTREGLANVIDRQPDLRVCHQSSNTGEAMEFLSGERPDLIVTDLTMPGRGGLEFVKDVRARWKVLPVLVLSMHDEMCYAERVLRAGARGYLMKDAGAEKVLAAIRHVLDGQVYVSQQMSMRLLDIMTSQKQSGALSPIDHLTDREFEVFQLIGKGRSTKEVANALRLSTKTVEAHRAHIKKKLQIPDALSLVHHAVCWIEGQGPGASQQMVAGKSSSER